MVAQTELSQKFEALRGLVNDTINVIPQAFIDQHQEVQGLINFFTNVEEFEISLQAFLSHEFATLDETDQGEKAAHLNRVTKVIEDALKGGTKLDRPLFPELGADEWQTVSRAQSYVQTELELNDSDDYYVSIVMIAWFKLLLTDSAAETATQLPVVG